MTLYAATLVALALDENTTPVLEKASELSPAQHIHLVHIEDRPVTGYGSVAGRHHLDGEGQLRQQLFPQLQALAQPYGIPGTNLHIEFGDPAPEILLLAKRLNAAVIVTGSQGKHGLFRSSVLSELVKVAHCDLLSVYTRP